MDDLWTPLTQPNPAAVARKCRRHDWHGVLTPDGVRYICSRCHARRDETTARRGRNNRSRGNREELTVARAIGGQKVGPLGHPWDVEISGYMRLQVKKLAKWPSLALVALWLDAIGIGQEMRAVAIVQPGRGGRRLLVLDLDEFARWHGDPTKGEQS